MDDASRPPSELSPAAESHGLIRALTLAAGTFDVDDLRDRFLDTTGLGKGTAWVNGFCLGRYWSRGPQRTLYLPGPILRTDYANELLVLELDTTADHVLRFTADANLGPVED